MKKNSIGRRQLMQYSAAGIALAASAKALAVESLSSAQSNEHLYKSAFTASVQANGKRD